MNTILEQVAPGLCDQLRGLLPSQRLQIGVHACTAIGQSIGELESKIIAILTSVSEGRNLSSDQLAFLRAYATEADERYFLLKEQGQEELQWRKWFAKARLATALVNLFSSDELEAVADAVYEISFVQQDNASVIKLITDDIKRLSQPGN